MAIFSEMFQQGAQFEGTLFDIDILYTAAANVSTAQFDINDKRAAAITKDIAKNGNLWVAPVVAVLDDVFYLVSGRHRVFAIDDLCCNYCINNAGKLITINHDNAEVYADLERIDAEILCQVITVADRTALNALIVAYNGSRSMTAAEKATTKVDAGSASALTKMKLAWSQELRGLFPVKITPQTALQFAGSLFSGKGLTPRAQHATPEQLTLMAATFSDWAMMQSQQGLLPETIARDYAAVWDAFITAAAPEFNAGIPAAEPKAKKQKAISKAEEMIRELQAQLLQLQQAGTQV